LKFSLGGDRGLNIFKSGFPQSRGISCTEGTPTAAVEETVNPGGSELTYDVAADAYTYVWKTEKAWGGNLPAAQSRAEGRQLSHRHVPVQIAA
jgi:hypothetical protein